MMVLQNTEPEEPRLGGLKMKGVGEESETAKYDLTLALGEGMGVIGGGLEYSRDLYERETIRRMARHYERVLEEVVRDADQRIGEIELMSEAERRQIVVEWNETSRAYPQDQCVHQLFAEQAKRTPERVALFCGGQWVSYGELNRRANQLGHYLQRLGVGPEMVVGLFLERSVEMVVGLMGTLKAGGAYLPFDPEAPLERLGYMLEDAGVGVALTGRELKERLPAHLRQTVLLDEEWEKMGQESENEPESGAVSENLAYVIYTSGSTGRPKGVAVSHRNLSNLICWHQREFNVGAGAHATQLARVNFDASVWEVWPYLTGGSSLHIVEESKRGDIPALIRWMIEEGITISFLPTPLAELALSERWPEGASLGVILTGGDRLRTAAPTDVPFKVVNNYGPTECTVVATSTWLNGDCEHTPPIGHGIANTKIYLLDERSEPVPVGVRGGLYISGEGLARGYYGKPEQTAERFIPNMFSHRGGERLYWTGDMGRYLPDGNIDFIGRVDEQIKVRGYRIELGEIEAILSAHESVKQSVVIAREDERGGKRLVGYVVGEEVSAAELKRYLKKRLPEYMAPEAIVVLAEMPLTANGKIDRKRLPVVEGAGRQIEPEYVAPRTPVEEVLVGILEEALQLDRVGVHDNFFEIGGHSLLATRVISQVRDLFEIEIEVKIIFEAMTVAELAEALTAREQKPGQTEKIALILKKLNSMTDEDATAELAARN
jgi:amino acid adenylation domain-containing protein